jgi:hypothetical protein
VFRFPVLNSIEATSLQARAALRPQVEAQDIPSLLIVIESPRANAESNAKPPKIDVPSKLFVHTQEANAAAENNTNPFQRIIGTTVDSGKTIESPSGIALPEADRV